MRAPVRPGSAGKDPQRAPVPLQLGGKLVDLKLLPGRLGIKGAFQKPGPPLEDQIKCLDKGGVKGLPEFGRHLVLQRPVQPGLRRTGMAGLIGSPAALQPGKFLFPRCDSFLLRHGSPSSVHNG